MGEPGRGAALFLIGLAKKAAVADTVAQVCDPIFARVAAGAHPSLAEAWAAAGTYTLQIYFDFSGYSDMAIGLALMFGFRLPLNFAAPYRAASIREFWRRWHITLSRFLRDYVYIPLGGNRAGPGRQAVNVVATMLLGGLWHGAAWTFVAWGGLHGLALAANSAWDRAGLRMPRVAGWLLTTLFVIVRLGAVPLAGFRHGGPRCWPAWRGRAGSGACMSTTRRGRGRGGHRAAAAAEPGPRAGPAAAGAAGWRCRRVRRWCSCCCWSAAGCRTSSSISSSDPWRPQLAWFVATALGLLAVVFLFVAVVDPWGMLPLSPPLPRVPISTNARFSMPALASAPAFDSAVVGSSSSRLLRPAVLDTLLGGRFANLAMNAATAWEQSQMLACSPARIRRRAP